MDTDQPAPQTNKSIIFVIVLTLAVNATLGMSTLAYCIIFKVEPNGVLLTAFVGMVNYILGAVSGMLVKTSPTETQKQLIQPPAPNGGPPSQVEVVNKPTDPVPTVEAIK